MTRDELKDRTRRFALLIIKFVEQLPNNITGRTIANQIIRSGTSVAANYRLACRARSAANFEGRISNCEFNSQF
jgi:four helix bundle protein